MHYFQQSPGANSGLLMMRVVGGGRAGGTLLGKERRIYDEEV